MSDDERALLRAVIADPDADLPRLVYADFLDDRGGKADTERANLIRYQVAHPDQETTANAALLSELPGNALASVRRGFAVWVSLSLAEFWATAAELFARHPIVAVRLEDRFPLHTGDHELDARPWVWTCHYPAESLIHESHLSDPHHPFGNGEWHLIPAELANLGDGSTSALARMVTFATDDEAADWLSDRCVRFGRTIAAIVD